MMDLYFAKAPSHQTIIIITICSCNGTYNGVVALIDATQCDGSIIVVYTVVVVVLAVVTIEVNFLCTKRNKSVGRL